ncbi:hypothetical protein RD110_10000 [Rhodoferax koreense]|uniref:Uncharacterized protein n=1 Tax=Rhodoferax koreensis TaxID=1842727 RepID=A0A1P8JUP0_9BURK|nr:hypothetical protein [Rhodoferax koreense]APW37479.1 hypothetical protein RD110_10000 [Rhodoferax koreense]
MTDVQLAKIAYAAAMRANGWSAAWDEFQRDPRAIKEWMVGVAAIRATLAEEQSFEQAAIQRAVDTRHTVTDPRMPVVARARGLPGNHVGGCISEAELQSWITEWSQQDDTFNIPLVRESDALAALRNKIEECAAICDALAKERGFAAARVCAQAIRNQQDHPANPAHVLK